MTLAYVVFQITVGRGSDRYGHRPFLLAGVTAVFAPSLAVAGDLTGGVLAALALVVVYTQVPETLDGAGP